MGAGQKSILNKFHIWLSFGRILPIITIAGAGIAALYIWFGKITTTPIENIMLALLTLLSVDSLSERITILEKLRIRLDELRTQKLFEDKSEIESFSKFTRHSEEIICIGVSLLSICLNDISFLKEKVRAGAKIKFIILSIC